MRSRALPVLFVLLALAGAATGCATREQDATAPTSATATGSAFPVTVHAPGGAEVTLDRRPQRIVSLNPSSTETLFALGAGAQVVAVDNQSDYPANAPRTALSGFKPNVEAIAGQNPDLVVASNDIDQLTAGLAKLKIPVLLLPAPSTLDDVYAEFSVLGKATGHQSEADALVSRTRDGIAQVVRDTPKPAHPLRYYHELDPSYYTVTSATFIGRVYGLFGLTNIADGTGAGDYPQLSAEQIVQANPDLVFLADTKCCAQNARTVGQRPGWSAVTAVRGGGVVALDDDIASRWGPRLPELVRAVSAAVARAGR